ncbi:centrosomal protein of 72 kDa isoform X4 [Rousettus aegyptiacus]|uniref:centrosomal protein of 72 kDa isoform X4 n=1 Tax=Rousettus aegyptiacus TaxID=9407 RepID=UPI00168D393F|nr:centrosomal protein of 72 kDa isoform X4 [Rousettus aegyptiacus]
MAPSGPRLPLSEEKIREKSGLAPHRDLAELRSLFIPGTYQEKITHLGNSLMNLTGLKSLDLSRNSLVSLEGIQYLAALESLNLYYNCISVLAEVFRLHSLKELADVDFRLNPVVKNEPDYRLFVVRLLPKLRQLDDRPVRESERKASWLHFASEESLDSTQRFPAVCRVERSCPSRAKCTDPSAKKCLVMDADDEAVLNLIAECEWGLSNPPGSSSQKECESDFHGPQGSTDGEDSAPPSQRSSLSAQTVSTPVPAAEKCRKRRLPGGRLQAPVHQVWPSGLGERGEHPSGPSSTAGSSRRDSSRSEASWLEEQGPRRSGSAREVSPKLQLAVPPGKQASLEVALLEALLDLVDRYWSGCKSLHGNEVFLAQARHILSSVEEFTATQDNSTIMSEEIRYLALENKSLQNRLADQQQQYSLKIHEVLSDLDSARKEMDDLRQQLDRSSEENNNLKSLLFSMKKEAQSTDSSAALSSQIPGFRSSKCCEMGLEPTRVVPQVVLAQEWVRAGRGPCGYSLLPPSEPVEARGGPWLWRPSAPRPLGVCPAVALLLGPDRGRRSRSPWPLFLPDSDRFYCPLFTLVGCVLRFRRSALGLQVQILGFRTRSCRRCSLWKLLRG